MLYLFYTLDNYTYGRLSSDQCDYCLPTFLTPVRGSMQANARAITCRSLCFAFSLNHNETSSVVLRTELPKAGYRVLCRARAYFTASSSQPAKATSYLFGIHTRID